MQLFSDLRSLAKKHRDASIRQARAEYEQTLQDIAQLEKRMAPPPVIERPKAKSAKTLIDICVDCLPRDRAFHLDELHGWVREAAPDRKPSKATIRSNLHRLLRQGVLKRVERANGRRRALFAVASLAVEREPTLREWVERITSEADGPLEPDEVLVRMLDAGYQPDCEPKEVIRGVRRLMKEIPLPE